MPGTHRTEDEFDEVVPAEVEPLPPMPSGQGEPASSGEEPLEALIEPAGGGADGTEGSLDAVDALVEPADAGEEALEALVEPAGEGAAEEDADVADALVEPLEGAAEAGNDDEEQRQGADLPVSGGAPKDKQGKHAKKRRIPWKRILAVLAVLLLVAALVIAGLFAWQRWYRFDDAADIQGVWQVRATGETVVFNAHELKITKSIAYSYKIDPQDKSISYTFGQYEGGGHYYLSDDRQTLVILEGSEGLGVLAELGFLPEDVLDGTRSDQGLTLMKRISDDVSAEPSSSQSGLSTRPGESGERPYIGRIGEKPSSAESEEQDASNQSSSSSRSVVIGADGYLYDESGDFIYDQNGNPVRADAATLGEDAYAQDGAYDEGEYVDVYGAVGYDEYGNPIYPDYPESDYDGSEDYGGAYE